MHTFFHAQLPTRRATVTLEPEEARHAAIRRIRPGEKVRLVDGRGGWAEASCLAPGRFATEAIRYEPEPTIRFYLLQAALPNEALGWAVQKAVELGAHAIDIFTAEHSAVQIERLRFERYQRIVREAAKQCGRARFPSLSLHASLDQALVEVAGALVWIADAQGRRPDFTGHPPAVALVVGPEGGFTQGEREKLDAARGVAVCLAPWILRSETVAAAGLALLQYGYGMTGQALP